MSGLVSLPASDENVHGRPEHTGSDGRNQR
jgi:hypothetical protein